MNTRSVLVVDDDFDLRSNIAEALEWEGYKVLQAENGQQALDLLIRLHPHEHPGCIILDLSMPVMDGQTFMKHLTSRRPNGLSLIPIVVATAKGGPAAPIHLPLPVKCIRKPMELNELYEVVKTFCDPPKGICGEGVHILH